MFLRFRKQGRPRAWGAKACTAVASGEKSSAAVPPMESPSMSTRA